ncbi:kinesin-domain-containing protein [Ceraceosorus guamensis]|uniref:Kinesin-domain-containing protein n=1 Tax=Ceraceosorus guamensis TaxID=1522189 RepID=A0A316VND4_9BASI|nr:kinesin-domain-containing protein [Ceraceosorus guamensis]PWN39076.1 kinesin-domain-containing protein [Ceraceosorus guamensis]
MHTSIVVMSSSTAASSRHCKRADVSESGGGSSSGSSSSTYHTDSTSRPSSRLQASPRGARAAPEDRPLHCGGGLDYHSSPDTPKASASSRSQDQGSPLPLRRTLRSQTFKDGSKSSTESTAAPPPTPRRGFKPTARIRSASKFAAVAPSSPASIPASVSPSRAHSSSTDREMTDGPAGGVRPPSRTSSRPLSTNYSIGNSNASETPSISRAKHASLSASTYGTSNSAVLEARRAIRRAAAPPLSTPASSARSNTPTLRTITTPRASAMLVPSQRGTSRPSSANGTPTNESTPQFRPASPNKFKAKITDGLSSRRGMTTPRHNATNLGLGISQRYVPATPSAAGVDTSRKGRRSAAIVTVPAVGELDDDIGDSSFYYEDEVEEADDDNASVKESVMVHVRLRPPRASEKCAWVPMPFTSTMSLAPDLAAARVQPGAEKPFYFDGVHTGSSNRPVYVSVARPLVRAALGGYDAVIFAYGQTASGKTFTLSGDDAGTEPGIIPRAVRDVFRGISQSERTREWLLRASYLEIHNETVKDLLDPDAVPQIRQDNRKGGRGTFVAPLREEVVTTQAAVRDLLARGQANRHVGATDWNERSSRSHTCFKLTIESWERDANGFVGGQDIRSGKKVRVSELSLIDLAGSERYVSQGTDRRTEGANINKSLLTLGKVIYALGERSVLASRGGDVLSQHVPYRDSKLTRILQNSLSGNARVAVVCTVNPSPTAVDESLSTLAFAKRVKKVSLHARRNEVDAVGGLNAEAQALLVRYRDEAEELRAQVQSLQNGTGSSSRASKAEVAEITLRLAEIRECHIRGGGEVGDESDEEYEAEVDDEEDELMDTASEPLGVVQAKLLAALTEIEKLRQQLASVPTLPAGWNPSDQSMQESVVARLQQQVRELDLVCEAQDKELDLMAQEPRALAKRIVELEKREEENQRLISSLNRGLIKSRKANNRLVHLASNQVSARVDQLRSPVKPSGMSVGGASPVRERRASATPAPIGVTFSSGLADSPAAAASKRPTLGTVGAATGKSRRSVSQDTAAFLKRDRRDVSTDMEDLTGKIEALMTNTKSSRWLTQDIGDLEHEIPPMDQSEDMSFA